ncbi:hypothetical protein [Aromatoleum petrolei]|uniref:Uncharacterized protein n=1 Tax=Aromatoleum petrolei TaxID=76116 RepID=A0ABX1ML62_9RHOO|nr:hypothetical protein [Aromatoleum petrolei]NMF87105.1 hypothetical protein [Aromatoleum petrolei]QTQ34842.1 Uncharacterized protein ToN1_06660 [Aromatoleum petrolei]
MPTTRTCPYCHTPIRSDRCEYATNGAYTYRICPDCDYSMPMPAMVASTPRPADAASDRPAPVVANATG